MFIVEKLRHESQERVDWHWKFWFTSFCLSSTVFDLWRIKHTLLLGRSHRGEILRLWKILWCAEQPIGLFLLSMLVEMEISWSRRRERAMNLFCILSTFARPQLSPKAYKDLQRISSEVSLEQFWVRHTSRLSRASFANLVVGTRRQCLRLLQRNCIF